MQLTKRHYFIIGGGLLVVALTLSAAKLRHRYDAVTPPEPTAAEQVTPPQPTAMPVTLPERTAIRVTLDQSLATNRSRPGEHFAATVTEPQLLGARQENSRQAHAAWVVADDRK